MRLNVDEFKTKYNEKITDNDDLLIELMEDITDSLSDSEEIAKLTSEIENLNSEVAKKEEELNEVKRKYKERFLTNEEFKEVDVYREDPVMEEEKVIDIKEI